MEEQEGRFDDHPLEAHGQGVEAGLPWILGLEVKPLFERLQAQHPEPCGSGPAQPRCAPRRQFGG